MAFPKHAAVWTSLLACFAFLGVLNAQSPPEDGIYDNAAGSPLIPLIKASQKEIAIEIYEMKDPDVLAALEEAMRRGVRMRIVIEPAPVGSSCRIFEPASSDDAADCRRIKRFSGTVKKAGGQFVPFVKDALCGRDRVCFQHGKLVLSDRKKALLSTGNFNSTSLCNLKLAPLTCNRDYTYLTSEPRLVRALQQVFESDSRGKTYDVQGVLNQLQAHDLTISPVSVDSLPDFIRRAQKTIRLENQYLHEPQLNESLMDAARRGVEVLVTVASLCSFGMPDESEKTKAKRIYSAFDRAGVKSRFFTGANLVQGIRGYLHSKAIVIDDERAWVGSTNGSITAVTKNREFGVFFDEPQWVAKLSSILRDNHTLPANESWQESLVCAKDPVPLFDPRFFLRWH